MVGLGVDAFFTSKKLAEKLFETTTTFLGIDEKDYLFLEPSAGSGAFSCLPSNCLAFDIAPFAPGIEQADFLELELKGKYSHLITIGNPPFGKRAVLAVEFFNHASEVSDAIAMIFPNQFNKFLTQKKLNREFKLVYSEQLPEHIFAYEDERPVNGIRCVFQIWVKSGSEFDRFEDLRILVSPPTTLEDVELWQHNGTKQSMKTVEEPWDLAVYRQGYKDYGRIFTHKDDYDFIKERMETSSDQFFFMHPKTNEAKERILRMDFDALASTNTTVKGFGKSDFCLEYLRLKEQGR